MDIKMYKLEVIQGKEELAHEWLSFLQEHKQQGERLLKNEQAYLEAYFTATENDKMYVYMFFAARDVDFSNQTAGESESQMDKKHFEYMRSCIDFNAGDILDCLFYLDNLEDVPKYEGRLKDEF